MESDAAIHLQTLVLTLGVIVSAIAIVANQIHARKIADEQAKIRDKEAAKKVTVEFILKYEIHDPDFQRSWLEAIVYLSSLSADDVESIAEAWSNRTLKDGQIESLNYVVHWLNHLEVVASAIQSGALDKDTYANWRSYTLFEDWSRAFPLVVKMRERDRGSDDLFVAIEELANEFRTLRTKN